MRGFSLIETFVAITILLLAVLGPLGLISKSIQDGSLAKNRIVAYYIAQQKMEEVIENISNDFDYYPEGCVEDCNYQFSNSDHPGVMNDFFKYNISITKGVIGVDSSNPNGKADNAEIGINVSWKERFLSSTQQVSIKNLVYSPKLIQGDPPEPPPEDDF